LPNLQGWDGKSQSKFRSKGAAIVRLVYKEIEEDLGIKEGWFEETYGDAEETAQWHVKVYNSGSISTTDEGVNVRLPVHTDPSLISVVLHDTPTREGGMGLEYLLTGKREWRSVSSCGHGRATVIVGSVMEKITGGRYKAARHRVVEEEGRVGEDRVAATFFFRPGGKKVLTVPPSAKLEGVKVVEVRTERKGAKRNEEEQSSRHFASLRIASLHLAQRNATHRFASYRFAHRTHLRSPLVRGFVKPPKSTRSTSSSSEIGRSTRRKRISSVRKGRGRTSTGPSSVESRGRLRR
jgi:isopenicillin N synthase-like dioxygenase